MLEAGRRALAQGALETAISSLHTASELAGAAPADEPLLATKIDEALVHALGGWCFSRVSVRSSGRSF